MSSRNEEAPSKKERRRSTSRVQLEENVFTTQISHYHQTMGYYSGVGPPFLPDRNCYNNINWSSRAPPWTGWTPPPPGTWMTSVSNGGMVATPQSFPCRVPNRVPPSPFNPPAMPPQPTPVIDPLLGSMHSPATPSNLRGWYARYPNDIPIQDVPMVVPSSQLDNIECLRHVGNHIRADHNFVEKTLMQKCETTASVCGTTVTRRSWYKMPEKSPPHSTKEKAIKSSDKTDNFDETAVLPNKVKKMDDTLILSSDYCSKLSDTNLSTKDANCLPGVPNHDTTSGNFTEYFLKRLMKKHQKESNMKKISVSNEMIPDIQVPRVLPEKRAPRVPISKNHLTKSHAPKTVHRIVQDVIDLSRDSPPPLSSEPNLPTNTTVITTPTPTTTTNNNHQNEAASCDLVITNSYSLSFSGVPNKTANTSSLIGARLSPAKRKLPDLKPSLLEDNQKENLIVSDSITDYQVKINDGRSKRKKYEPRKRDSFVIEDDTSCWVSETMNKLIDNNFLSNNKNVVTSNLKEKPLPNDHTSSKRLNKIDNDNAPEYCDIVDILHSLSESGPNSQGAEHVNQKDSAIERKVIQTTNSIKNDKCITLDDTDDSDSPHSRVTITPGTVIRSRQSLDTLSTADNSVDSIHDSTISSSSLDNNDTLEEGITKKDLFSLAKDKECSKDDDNPSLTSSENTSTVLKENITCAEKEKVDEKQLSSENGSSKESTKLTWTPLKVAKPLICKIPKMVPILPIKKQPIEHRISDEELETLEGIGQKKSLDNSIADPLTDCRKKEETKDSAENEDKPQNDMKRLSENLRPVKVCNSLENLISINDGRLENFKEAPSVGNESDDNLPSGHSLSESPLLEGIGSCQKLVEKDGKETAAITAASLDDPQEAEAKMKQTLDPVLEAGSLPDESQPQTESNSSCDKKLDQDPNSCATSNSKEIMTACLTDCNETVPTGTLQQQAGFEVLNLSKKVLLSTNLKEINQTPCLEISENGDMKVIAIVTDYEESTCDNLLGLSEPKDMLGNNSNVIITPIDSLKKGPALECSKHTSSSPFKEFHKSKMLNLADYDKCKNPKGNGSLYSSFLNSHKEKDVFSKNCNGDIVILNDSTSKTKQLSPFSSCSVHDGGTENQVLHLEPANSALGLNIMSVEMKPLSSAMEYSADKLSQPPVSTLVDKSASKLKCAPKMDSHLIGNHEKNPKRKKKKIKSKKNQNKTKSKTFVKKLKKRKLSNKKSRSKKMHGQSKKKSLRLKTNTGSVDLQDSLASCNGKVSNLSKNSKTSLKLALKNGSKTPLAKYDLNILRNRISSACPDRRGRIFSYTKYDSTRVIDKTIEPIVPLDKQCQTDNPFYGCLTHAFIGSCCRLTEKHMPSPIIHKFVKFHGHKLLCIIINVKKYVIVRELVQKCFLGRNQVMFYRTKYRDYSFPYLELPFHMKSFALKYLIESGTLFTGNRATPLSIMLLSDAEIIYHFFYSFRECNLTACIQDWSPDNTGVYDPDWLKVLEATSTVSMKTEPPDTDTETGLSANCLCACRCSKKNIAPSLGQCRTVACKPLKRPMLGIFEPSFESPVFGTTSSSTQTSPLDTNSSVHPKPVDDNVLTKIVTKDDNPNPILESNHSTIPLEDSLTYSNSLMTLGDVDVISSASNYCDYISKPLSSGFVCETHRNDDAEDNNSSSSDPLSSPHLSSSGLPFEEQLEEGNSTGNPANSLHTLSSPAQTPDFVLGGMTLLDGKVVRFIELSGQRHFLLTDLNSSWSLSAVLDKLLESDIVVHRCSSSERSFLLSLSPTLPQVNADDMLLIADEFFPRLKTCLSVTAVSNSCHVPHAVYSEPGPEPLTPDKPTRCPNESQTEQNDVFADEKS